MELWLIQDSHTQLLNGCSKPTRATLLSIPQHFLPAPPHHPAPHIQASFFILSLVNEITTHLVPKPETWNTPPPLSSLPLVFGILKLTFLYCHVLKELWILLPLASGLNCNPEGLSRNKPQGSKMQMGPRHCCWKSSVLL